MQENKILLNNTSNKTSNKIPEISVAPMMDWTDRHCRYFHRLFSPNILLYTEMVVVNAIIYGDKNRFLAHNPEEHPVALQLGGSDPNFLSKGAKLAQEYGYSEVNLNVGCPSDRVQKNKIGACLMAEPDLVADCILAMTEKVDIPVTVKTRIGIDNLDSYEFLYEFIDKVSRAGCSKFIIHARKAWLSGLSPKQNRLVPELDYNKVIKIKQDFDNLQIIINGGFDNLEKVNNIINNVDGVMIGRAAYHNPWLLAELDNYYFNQNISNTEIISHIDIINKLKLYIYNQLKTGIKWHDMARHFMGLFKSQPGAKAWRYFLSESRDIDYTNCNQKIDDLVSRILLFKSSENLDSDINIDLNIKSKAEQVA